MGTNLFFALTLLCDFHSYVDINSSYYILTDKDQKMYCCSGTQMKAVITRAHSRTASNVTLTLPREVIQPIV